MPTLISYGDFGFTETINDIFQTSFWIMCIVDDSQASYVITPNRFYDLTHPH